MIAGLDGDAPDTRIYHAGTSEGAGCVATSGGRVLCVCGLGEDVSEARRRAYERAGMVHWDGAFYRRDIGYRAVERERNRGRVS